MSFPVTGLRRSYRRARSLGFEEQLRECVDQLQHPELIESELFEAHASVARCLLEQAPIGVLGSPGENDKSEHFYASRDIFVLRDTSSFTCLASNVEPLVLAGGATGEMEGLDYVGVTCTAQPRPVLGVVQSEGDNSAYPLLLRQLACLCELAHASQLSRIDCAYFRGMLGESPGFDLHLVLWDDWLGEDEVPERTPISQLARDLAERVKADLAASERFPAILHDIVCLHMNPERFDARVRFSWRV